MPEFSGEFWIMLVTYAASFGVIYGQITTKLKSLEKKMDKHNNIVERLATVERDLKTAFSKIDELKEEVREHHPIRPD